jgi:hypothetical protein
MAVNATGADAIRALPTAFVYHFTLPHTIEFLPEVSESLGMKVELKNTGKNGLDHFFDYVKGDLKYEHIDDDKHRRMNDWLTAWVVLNTAWPYVPVLGLIKAYKIGVETAKAYSKDESNQMMGGILSLLLTAPFNVIIGFYEAANFTSARLRVQGIDKAFLEATEKLPEVVGAGFDADVKSQPKNELADIVARTAAMFSLVPFMPLLGTYKVTETIGDLTHKDRVVQFATMLLGAPILATIGLPVFALSQAAKVANTMVNDSNLNGWVSKFFGDTSKALSAASGK